MLGSSAGRIVVLVTGEHMRLVLPACLAAVPLVWVLMSWWLGRFAFRIELEIWMLAVASMAAMLIPCATVGYQTLRAAFANPVDVLRHE